MRTLFSAKPVLLALAVGGLAACDTADGNRAIAGAFTGATVAAVTDGNLATGAAVGAAAGALCDDVRVCD